MGNIPFTFDDFEEENEDAPGYMENSEAWDGAIDKVTELVNDDIKSISNIKIVNYAKGLILVLEGMKG